MADIGNSEAGEGRRERKRRQTRERIEQAAMTLFLDRGFDATTIEDITEIADVSKRSFFDYFPSKEDVVFAWQDSFADRLKAAIAARPADEPSVQAAEQVLLATIAASFDQRGLAVGALIQCTPTLKARDQLKYAKLEQKLFEALWARRNDDPAMQMRMRLLAAIIIGAMRVGGETWQQRPPGGSMEDFAREIFAGLRQALAEFSDEPTGA